MPYARDIFARFGFAAASIGFGAAEDMSGRDLGLEARSVAARCSGKTLGDLPN